MDTRTVESIAKSGPPTKSVTLEIVSGKKALQRNCNVEGHCATANVHRSVYFNIKHHSAVVHASGRILEDRTVDGR